jgi:ATP-dependent DNA helicase RecQ
VQEYIKKDGGERLEVTPKGWLVLRGEVTPRLLAPARVKPKESAAKKKVEAARRDWAGDLFDMLKVVRRGLAEELELPPYVIFSDNVLRAMAKDRPANMPELRQIQGVGQWKAKQYGEKFLRVIKDYEKAHAQ